MTWHVVWIDHRITWLLLATSIVMGAVAAGILGIDDNPPGLALMLVALVAGVSAFAYRIRTGKRMLLLALGALVGFLVFVVLHNLLEGLAAATQNVAILSPALGGLGVVCFLLAIFVCPPGLLVGLTGAALSRALRDRKSSTRAGVLFGVTAGVAVVVSLTVLYLAG